MSAKLQKPTRRNKKDIAERLKSLRVALELSQQALADKAKLSRSSIVHYERGTVIPGGQELIKLATVLNVTPNDILGITEKRGGKTSMEKPIDLDEALSIVQIMIFFSALDKKHKQSISILIKSALKAQLRQKEYSQLLKLSELLKPIFTKMFPAIEEWTDVALDDESIQKIELEINALGLDDA